MRTVIVQALLAGYLEAMFEHRTHRLLSPNAFLLRQFKFLFAALVVVVVSLAIGVYGYMGLAEQSFPDAFLNASVILGGMGPIGDLPNNAAKYFAASLGRSPMGPMPPRVMEALRKASGKDCSARRMYP